MNEKIIALSELVRSGKTWKIRNAARKELCRLLELMQ